MLSWFKVFATRSMNAISTKDKCTKSVATYGNSDLVLMRCSLRSLARRTNNLLNTNIESSANFIFIDLTACLRYKVIIQSSMTLLT